MAVHVKGVQGLLCAIISIAELLSEETQSLRTGPVLLMP